MEDLLLSVETRVAKHDSREDDHILKHTNFRFADVEVAIIRKRMRPNGLKITLLGEDLARAIDVDELLVKQRPKHVRIILPCRFNAKLLELTHCAEVVRLEDGKRSWVSFVHSQIPGAVLGVTIAPPSSAQRSSCLHASPDAAGLSS